MNWKYKALLQQVLSTTPEGEWANYLFQRYVTRSLPPSDAKLAEVVAHAREHIAAIKRYRKSPLSEAVFYEFGAGFTLAIPLAFHCHGVNRQVLVDIRPLLRPALVNDVIVRLQRLGADGRCSRIPDRGLASRKNQLFLEQLETYYGIEYLAPFDARDTQLAANSVDCITSTNTLEHIPPADIRAILRECHRILTDDGLMSFRIDYQDHYSYFDGSITVYNFLQYSDRHWRVYNPALHYQNRLRHRDYVALLTEAGFSVLEQNLERPSAEDLKVLRDIQLDARFRGYNPDELGIRSSLIVLQKSSG